MSDNVQVLLPPKMAWLMQGESRYRCAYGGRGSGKTRSFALMSALYGYKAGMSGYSGSILCCREHMNSIKNSSLAEVKAAIESYDFLKRYYVVTENTIKSIDGRIQYDFAGLRTSLNSVLSKSNILICWIDEAERVSSEAWRKLPPTVRAKGSEIWVSWNPESPFSATHERFRVKHSDNVRITELNWSDNPFFPEVLESERVDDLNLRPEVYDHIWEGDFMRYREGAYYLKQFQSMESEGRIREEVMYTPELQVITAWDLGHADSTSIWFYQVSPSGEIRVIDFYENSGESLDHYVKVLKEKEYIYSHHLLPHDVKVTELTTGKSRKEVLERLGLTGIKVVSSLTVDEGINAVREILPRCWINSAKCEHGITCMKNYTKEWDENNNVWKSRPLHDWTSHAADAFRYFAVGFNEHLAKSSNYNPTGEAIKRNLYY